MNHNNKKYLFYRLVVLDFFKLVVSRNVIYLRVVNEPATYLGDTRFKMYPYEACTHGRKRTNHNERQSNIYIFYSYLASLTLIEI